jgi:hypothetical protein
LDLGGYEGCLFLREKSEDLMAYRLALFDEEDYLNFAMMFGIRDKFINIPKDLREFKNLQNFISQKMAEYAHSMLENSLAFKPISKPMTLREMFNKTAFKKRMIKTLALESCMHTVMPNKAYSSKSGINTYHGFIEPRYEVIEEAYFKIISQKTISKDEYDKFSRIK